MDGQSNVLIRKLRKKLRQIENLSRSDRTLSKEEQEKVDAKKDIRSELKELVAAEEEAMVKLSEQIKSSALEEKRVKKKLGSENVISREIEENNHQVSNPTDGLLDLNEDGEVVLATESDREFEQPTPEGKKINTGENGIKKSSVDGNIKEIHNGGKAAAPNESVETKITATQDISQEIVEPRRSLKPKKQQGGNSNNHRTNGSLGSDVFANMDLKTCQLEGHHHDICSVDMHGKYIVSAGRDTSLKLWDSLTLEELQSYGGHESTITKVMFLKDREHQNIPQVLTASTDCSIRLWDMDEGKMSKSIYVYNTITCMDYKNGKALVGTDGGKMEVYDIESGSQCYSVNVYHGISVTAVKFLDSLKVVCGSATGDLKIYNTSTPPKDNNDTPIFTLDNENIIVSSKSENGEDKASTSNSFLNPSKINCMAVYEDLVIYGDNGFNIKVLDYQKGKLTKVRNNLKEFCPTEALYVGQYQSTSCLFSVGSDVDNGDSYINMRSLPDFKYLGTIRDSETNSGSVTAICQEEIDNKLYLVTGGLQLRVWNQLGARSRGRKRKNSPNGDPAAYVPCKYICNFTDPRDSEPESDMETEMEGSGNINRGDNISGSKQKNVERVAAGSESGSWCAIL